MRSAPTALAALLFVTGTLAQTRPMEFARPSPTPAHVAPNGIVAFTREFAAQRADQRVALAWLDQLNSGEPQLRTSLLAVSADGSLDRVRADHVVTTSVRTPAIAWNGVRGLLAWVVPPPSTVPPRPVPGAPPTAPTTAPTGPAAPGRRSTAVGLPPSTADSLGPRDRSGGDIAVQRLDAEGRPTGPVRVVFHENARLTRLSLALTEQGAVLAWTGAQVTDDEVRGAVRVMRLRDDGAPATPMALNAGFVGETGAVLSLAPMPDHVLALRLSGRACASVPGAWPTLRTDDASARVETANRTLMPQQPLREVPGPEITCGPLTLFEATVGVEGPVGPLAAVAPLAWDADLRDAYLAAPPGAGTPVDLTPRVRPAPDFEPRLVELPVAPPLPTADEAFTAPRVAVSNGTATAAVDRSGHALVLRTAGRARVLATSPVGFAELRVLPGTPSLLLSREGVWSGPLRAWSFDAPEVPTVELPRAWVMAALIPPPRAPIPHPYVFDEPFARLWVRARTARAVFMRFENTAGSMAARPEAPTDPRMPPILAQRARLMMRWQNACGALGMRAALLARRGAGQPVLQGVESLCTFHPDLQLGVPINQAL